MKRIANALLVGLFLSVASHAFADVRTDVVQYSDGDTKLEGFFAVPELKSGEKRPGILLIHDWTGLGDYEKMRAKKLAALGYIVFAGDVYGEGIRPTDPKECGVQAGIYRGKRDLFRKRLNLALEMLKKHKGVDQSRLGAIGYCFGGAGVLELARSGADVKGVVSFHGGLDSPKPEDGKNIRSKILILHGADDPFVPRKNIDACLAELDQWKVDWQMVSYSGTVHSFTNPSAGDDPSTGSAYNKDADQRSWAHMKMFFDELFGK